MKLLKPVLILLPLLLPGLVKTQQKDSTGRSKYPQRIFRLEMFIGNCVKYSTEAESAKFNGGSMLLKERQSRIGASLAADVSIHPRVYAGFSLFSKSSYSLKSSHNEFFFFLLIPSTTINILAQESITFRSWAFRSGFVLLPDKRDKLMGMEISAFAGIMSVKFSGNTFLSMENSIKGINVVQNFSYDRRAFGMVLGLDFTQRLSESFCLNFMLQQNFLPVLRIPSYSLVSGDQSLVTPARSYAVTPIVIQVGMSIIFDLKIRY